MVKSNKYYLKQSALTRDWPCCFSIKSPLDVSMISTQELDLHDKLKLPVHFLLHERMIYRTLNISVVKTGESVCVLRRGFYLCYCSFSPQSRSAVVQSSILFLSATSSSLHKSTFICKGSLLRAIGSTPRGLLSPR